jgi:hypothetical protein
MLRIHQAVPDPHTLRLPALVYGTIFTPCVASYKRIENMYKELAT